MVEIWWRYGGDMVEIWWRYSDLGTQTDGVALEVEQRDVLCSG